MTDRERLEKLARRLDLRLDKLDDEAAATKIIAHGTRRDARAVAREAPEYRAAALREIERQYADAAPRRDDARLDDPALDARYDSRVAYQRMLRRHEDAWREPLLSDVGEHSRPGVHVSLTMDADQLRSATARARADAARWSEDAWQSPLRATREDVIRGMLREV